MTESAIERVRQELGAGPVVADEVPAELGALLRGAGTLVRRGPGWGIELLTPTGAVARRAHHLLRAVGAEPTVLVREATNVQRRTYGVVVAPVDTAAVGSRLGLLDEAGRPRATAPAEHRAEPAAMVRGALLGAGSVSAPGRPSHLELRATSAATAQQLAAVVEELTGTSPSIGRTRSGVRATLKSRTAIVALLERAGAPRAAAVRRDVAERRRLRADAQRLTNADAANVARAVAAAGDQVALVERVVAEVGWEALPDELRDVALARLANPAASLGELGQLCDPPVGKSAVHRRLARLRTLLEG